MDRVSLQLNPADLQGENRVVLFEDEVPNVECAVHLSGVEHGWPRGTPAAIRQVRHVIPEWHETSNHALRSEYCILYGFTRCT